MSMLSRINASGSTNHGATSNMIFTTQTDPTSAIVPKLQDLRDLEYAGRLPRYCEERIYATFYGRNVRVAFLFRTSLRAFGVAGRPSMSSAVPITITRCVAKNRFRGTIRRIMTHPGFSLIESSFQPFRSLAHCTRRLFHPFCSICASFDVALR